MTHYTYGHGTENDFILVFDPNDEVSISPEAIANLCNRKSGVGADGLIRMVKQDGTWFMDYRNADGSLAEMCGNGIRVMARYLRDHNEIDDRAEINTRAGVKKLVTPVVGDISVEMGPVRATDQQVKVTAPGGTWDAVGVDVGNPHAVAFVDDLDNVGSLAQAPAITPPNAFPDGVNVEFVRELDRFHVSMRVHERGSGETRSCGTGTCAVAFAAAQRNHINGPSSWVVDVPGGRVMVDLDANGYATLSGPAVLVAEGVFDPKTGARV